MDLKALEARARENLGGAAYDYFAGGADDEVTVAANDAAWLGIRLRPRVLRGVGEVDLGTSVLGTAVSMPVLVAPLAYQRLATDEGEAPTARAAAAAGIAMVASTFSTVSLEDIAAAAPGAARWFQLYVHSDRGLTADLVSRAAATGYGAIVLTVDLPVLGNRRRDELNRFTLPDGLEMANIGMPMPVVADGSGTAAWADHAIDSSLSMADLEWLRSLSDLPLVVKGVLRGDDAAAAVAAGAAAVIVSNHGGRQLDTSLPTADALLDVASAVGDRAEVYVDGGVRRGTDVVKALALGARAVLVGRPVLWGLAVGAEAGVGEVLEGYRTEISRAFALCGASTPADIDFSLLA